jgi:transketolase
MACGWRDVALEENIEKRIGEFAFHMRRHALTMAYASGNHAVHFGAAMSIVDILAVLYAEVLRLDRQDPMWEDRDRFILSKGHGTVGYYAALAEFGYIPLEELKKFEQGSSCLMGHPVYTPEYGIEFTNGSLGMGLSLGIGTALSAKRKGKGYKTFVLIGDGESDEGAIWEGVMSAPHFQLDNLCVIVDRNRLQLGGDTEAIMAHGDLKEKFRVFGWNAFEVDGHNLRELYELFNQIPRNRRPTAVIANTIKGKGFHFSENNNAWHHAVMTGSQYEEALKELEDGYYGNNRKEC